MAIERFRKIMLSNWTIKIVSNFRESLSVQILKKTRTQWLAMFRLRVSRNKVKSNSQKRSLFIVLVARMSLSLKRKLRFNLLAPLIA